MLAKRIAVPGLQWAGILVLVTAVSLAAGLRSAGAAEGWLVREQPGTLQYRLPESSAWSPASPGLELQPGTTVRAGRGRPAVLARADSSIAIRGGTELTLPPTGTETVVQRLGSARYQIAPGTVSDFLVETPYLVIGIKGTIFDVLVNEAGTKVEVSEGLVEVTTPDGRFRARLAPGQTARVGAATGSAPQVQSNAGGADAPAPQDSSGSATPDQLSRSDAGSPLTPAEVGGAISPVTSAAKSLWSGIGDLLSDVDVVSDDHLTTRRRGTLVRTLSGGIASVGSGAGGDSGGGTSGGGSSSGGGNGGGGSSSGGGGSSSSGSGRGSSSGSGGSANSGSGSGGGGSGGGLGGAVGGVSGAVGGAVGGVSSAVGGIGKGLGGAVGGLGNGGGKRGKR